MYAIHVVCLSVRQTFAYYIPLYNASHFLDSLVVCCTQELSSIGRRGLYLSVSKPCRPVWSVSSETAAAAGGGWEGGYQIHGRIQSASSVRALRISPELKETSILTT